MSDFIGSPNEGRTIDKRGKYLLSEYLITIRDLLELRAHISTYGNVRQTFEKFASNVNEDQHTAQKLN